MARFVRESLEALLTKILAHDDDWVNIKAFCAEVLKDHDLAPGAVQMCLNELRSHNLTVALRALTLLEALVRGGGAPVHNVIGKFRFLNELIKLVSPKYSPNTHKELVERILFDMHYWSYNLPDLVKIHEACHMMREQAGIEFPYLEPASISHIKAGDGFMDVSPLHPRESPLEADKKKADLLAKLLKSKDPKDLMKANKLIKKMADEHDKKSVMSAKLKSELELIQNNARLLTDMLTHYLPGVDPLLENNEVIQDIYKACSDMRPKLIKLIHDMEGKGDDMGHILAINDELGRVLDLYSRVLSAQTNAIARGAKPNEPSLLGLQLGSQQARPVNHLDDELLSDFSLQGPAVVPQLPSPTTQPPPAFAPPSYSHAPLVAPVSNVPVQKPLQPAVAPAAPATGNSLSLDGLFSAPNPKGNAPFASQFGSLSLQPTSQPTYNQGLPSYNQGQPSYNQGQPSYNQGQPSYNQAQPSYNQGYNQGAQSSYGQSGVSQPAYQQNTQLFSSLGSSPLVPMSSYSAPAHTPLQPTPLSAATSHVLQPTHLTAPTASVLQPTSAGLGFGASPLIPVPTLQPSTLQPSVLQPSVLQPAAVLQPQQPLLPPQVTANAAPSLLNINVPIQSIRPSDKAPIDVYNKNGLRILFHVAKDTPHPSIVVLVASYLNLGNVNISEFLFQAAVPKTQQVKLQTASATALPAMDPFKPPSTVTQIILVSNPLGSQIRIRFKLKYNASGVPVEDNGEVAIPE